MAARRDSCASAIAAPAKPCSSIRTSAQVAPGLSSMPARSASRAEAAAPRRSSAARARSSSASESGAARGGEALVPGSSRRSRAAAARQPPAHRNPTSATPAATRNTGVSASTYRTACGGRLPRPASAGTPRRELVKIAPNALRPRRRSRDQRDAGRRGAERRVRDGVLDRSTSTCITEPSPSRPRAGTARRRRSTSRGQQTQPDGHSSVPARGRRGSAAGREIAWPEPIDVTRTPSIIGTRSAGGLGRAFAVDRLEVERQERHRAEQREADDQRQGAGHAEHRLAPERGRKHRLLRPALDGDEQRQWDDARSRRSRASRPTPTSTACRRGS